MKGNFHLNIVWTKNKYQIFFFLRYINPDVILKQSNVHLLGVHKDKAFFSVTDPFEDLYDVRTNHFLYETTFWKAKSLILVPLSHFKTLAQKCGDPAPGSVAIMSGTSR